MSRKLVLLILILLSQGRLAAQTEKFGFVEDKRILRDLPAVKEVQKILDRESTIWEKQFGDRQTALKVVLDSVTAMETQILQEQKTVRSAADTAAAPDTAALRSELNRLLQRAEQAKKETVGFYRRIYGDSGLLKRRNSELSQSVLERVNRAIDDKGRQLGFTAIFDSSVLLYVDQEYNITEQVMEALNMQTDQKTR